MKSVNGYKLAMFAGLLGVLTGASLPAQAQWSDCGCSGKYEQCIAMAQGNGTLIGLCAGQEQECTASCSAQTTGQPACQCNGQYESCIAMAQGNATLIGLCAGENQQCWSQCNNNGGFSFRSPTENLVAPQLNQSTNQSVWEEFSKQYSDANTGFNIPASNEVAASQIPKDTALSGMYELASRDAQGSDFGGVSVYELSANGQPVFALRWSTDLNWGPDAGYRLALFTKSGDFIAGYYNNDYSGSKADKKVLFDRTEFLKAVK